MKPILGLIKSYELEYRIMRYKKLYKSYICGVIEKHNCEMLITVLEEMLID